MLSASKLVCFVATENGIVLKRYEGLLQDPLGIWSTPDGTRVAWFKDPDGHTLSLTQPGEASCRRSA